MFESVDANTMFKHVAGRCLCVLHCTIAHSNELVHFFIDVIRYQGWRIWSCKSERMVQETGIVVVDC